MTKGRRKGEGRPHKVRAKRAPTGYHPLANLFPMMGEHAFRELRADIEARGMLSPIWTHEGQIVDGRNRHRACLELGIEPVFREWDQQGDLVDFVLSLNLKRRHLTATQRAVVAFRLLPMLEAEGRYRQTRRPVDSEPEILPEQRGDSRDHAAVLVGVSGRYVSDMKRIAAAAPEKLKVLESGALTLQGAKRQLEREKGRLEVETSPQGTEAAKIAAAVIRQLSKIKDDDPQALVIMDRVMSYAGNRIRSAPSNSVKTGPLNGNPTGEQLILFKR